MDGLTFKAIYQLASIMNVVCHYGHHSARIVVPVYDCGHRKPDVHLGQRPKHLLLYETSAMGDITCFTRLSGIWINDASDGVMNTNQLMRESAPEQILQISQMEQMFFLSGFRAIMRDIN